VKIEMSVVRELTRPEPSQHPRVQAEDHALDVLLGVADVEGGYAGDEIVELRERRDVFANRPLRRDARSCYPGAIARTRWNRHGASHGGTEQLRLVFRRCGSGRRAGRRPLRTRGSLGAIGQRPETPSEVAKR